MFALRANLSYRSTAECSKNTVAGRLACSSGRQREMNVSPLRLKLQYRGSIPMVLLVAVYIYLWYPLSTSTLRSRRAVGQIDGREPNPPIFHPRYCKPTMGTTHRSTPSCEDHYVDRNPHAPYPAATTIEYPTMNAWVRGSLSCTMGSASKVHKTQIK